MMTYEEFVKVLRRAYVDIALADHRDELSYADWYLEIDEDGEYTWYPGCETGAIATYSRDPEMQDMTRDEVIEWVDDCLKATYKISK